MATSGNESSASFEQPIMEQQAQADLERRQAIMELAQHAQAQVVPVDEEFMALIGEILDELPRGATQEDNAEHEQERQEPAVQPTAAMRFFSRSNEENHNEDAPQDRPGLG